MAEASNGSARSTINHIFGYVVIPIVLRCNGFSLCYSRKVAKTVLYNEILREGSREEWKWKGERNVCFVIERCG